MRNIDIKTLSVKRPARESLDAIASSLYSIAVSLEQIASHHANAHDLKIVEDAREAAREQGLRNCADGTPHVWRNGERVDVGDGTTAAVAHAYAAHAAHTLKWTEALSAMWEQTSKHLDAEEQTSQQTPEQRQQAARDRWLKGEPCRCASYLPGPDTYICEHCGGPQAESRR